jgi:alanyl-tRNA synthetase
MSFITIRDRIFSEKLRKAQEVRELKAQSITLTKLRHDSVRKSLEKSSERLHKLEDTLKKVHYLREQQDSIKSLEMKSKKFIQHSILKEKVKKNIEKQELKQYLSKPTAGNLKISLLPNINSPETSIISSPQSFSKSPDHGFLHSKRILKHFKIGKH